MSVERVLRSELLSRAGIAHGFSVRTGGVSVGAYESLNVGRGQGDDPAAVETNRARLSGTIGYDASRLFEVSQVHGAHVRVIRDGDDAIHVRAEEGDALIARVPSHAIGVRVADCVPILFADPEAKIVAAVHAGWRGVVADIVGAAMAKLDIEGASRARVLAAFGPHIRSCCFEVGADVGAQIDRAAGSLASETRSGRTYADLSMAIRAQLTRQGIARDRQDDVAGCSRCEPERFFSYRRDGAKSGRMIGIIVVPR